MNSNISGSCILDRRNGIGSSTTTGVGSVFKISSTEGGSDLTKFTLSAEGSSDLTDFTL